MYDAVEDYISVLVVHMEEKPIPIDKRSRSEIRIIFKGLKHFRVILDKLDFVVIVLKILVRSLWA